MIKIESITNQIINDDCMNILKQLPDKCVDLVITSPPYYKLRRYGTDKNELGQELSVDLYINNLICIFNEVFRVLKDTGSVWVNIDDCYNKKGLLCIPDKFKIKMTELGFICRNEVIWQKPNSMPSSVKDRFNNDYEKFFFFVKTSIYKFQTQYEPLKANIIKDNKNVNYLYSKYENIEQESNVRQGLNKNRGKKIIEKRNHLPRQEFFINFMRSSISINDLVYKSGLKQTMVEHWYRKDKAGFSYPSKENWEKIKKYVNQDSEDYKIIDFGLTNIDYETDSIYKNITTKRIKRAVWSICTKPSHEKHYACYPQELCKIPILACTQEGDIVMDIFSGSGTTCEAAYNLKRQFIGMEKYYDYWKASVERLTNAQAQLKLF